MDAALVVPNSEGEGEEVAAAGKLLLSAWHAAGSQALRAWWRGQRGSGGSGWWWW